MEKDKMKNLHKSLTSFFLAGAITLAATTATSKKAEAGIIVGLTAGVAGALVGLAISSAGFFWGIQSEDLNWKAGALFVLDEQLKSDELTSIISQKYPELDSYLVEEIANLVAKNSNLVEFNANNFKEIILSEAELSPVLEVLNMTNPELSEQIRVDLTQSSI